MLYPLEEVSPQGLGGAQGTQAASGGYGGTSSIEGVGHSAVSGAAGGGLDQESVSRAFAAAMAAAKGSLSTAHHASPATSGN